MAPKINGTIALFILNKGSLGAPNPPPNAHYFGIGTGASAGFDGFVPPGDADPAEQDGFCVPWPFCVLRFIEVPLQEPTEPISFAI